MRNDYRKNLTNTIISECVMVAGDWDKKDGCYVRKGGGKIRNAKLKKISRLTKLLSMTNT